jgi:hypothetical protein
MPDGSIEVKDAAAPYRRIGKATLADVRFSTADGIGKRSQGYMFGGEARGTAADDDDVIGHDPPLDAASAASRGSQSILAACHKWFRARSSGSWAS